MVAIRRKTTGSQRETQNCGKGFHSSGNYQAPQLFQRLRKRSLFSCAQSLHYRPLGPLRGGPIDHSRSLGTKIQRRSGNKASLFAIGLL